jgi:hypothetical protein
MLDVHPPHVPTHTWRDFLIHIATIVIGLLIAIGLEQTVEYIHHRREVAETRKTFRHEHQRNALVSRFTTTEYLRASAAMQANLAIFLYLQQHPGAPSSQWPAKLNWSRWTIGPTQAAWDTAQKSTVLSFMPTAEVRGQADYYNRMDSLHSAQNEFATAVVLAQTYRIRQPDASKLSPAQIDKEIDLLTDVLYHHYMEGVTEANIADNYPEFASPSRAELTSIMHSAYEVDPALIEQHSKLKHLLMMEDTSGSDKP